MQNAKHFITLLCGLLNVVTEVFFRFKFSTGLATTPLRQRVTMFRHRDLNIFKKILVHEALLRCRGANKLLRAQLRFVCQNAQLSSPHLTGHIFHALVCGHCRHIQDKVHIGDTLPCKQHCHVQNWFCVFW